VTIPGVILSFAWRNCIVREESHPDALWDVPDCSTGGGRQANAVPVAEVVEEQVKIDEKFFEQEIGQRTLQTFGGRDLRWTTTTIRRRRISPPFGMRGLLPATFTKVNGGVWTALIGASLRGKLQ
jgi:hypothetical protein